MIAILLDENFNTDITRGIRRRYPTVDLVDVREVGLGGSDDPTVLAWAATVGRVVVTHDVNTMPRFAFERVKSRSAMPDIIIVPDQMSVGQAIEDLLTVILCSLDGEYVGRVFYLPL